MRRADGSMDEAGRARNRNKIRIRARVEHPFLTLKCLWGWAKVRYRGLAKNANKAFAMLALADIVKWNRPLTPQVRLA